MLFHVVNILNLSLLKSTIYLQNEVLVVPSLLFVMVIDWFTPHESAKADANTIDCDTFMYSLLWEIGQVDYWVICGWLLFECVFDTFNYLQYSSMKSS